jgi:dTDP-4-amino-4,6-dideoxygalactose transaminase
MNPFQVVKDFEKALCDYTGAKYAVTTTSCTSALLLACAYVRAHSLGARLNPIILPRRTYVGVAQSVVHAEFKIVFEDVVWDGGYQLYPTTVWDYARRFTSGMYRPGEFHCVSFHPTKILGLSGYGGAILHDDDEADEWLRRSRFDGRKEGVPPSEDDFTLGWHCYMSPVTAAEGLLRLSTLPRDNPDVPNDEYPDLSKCEVFK